MNELIDISNVVLKTERLILRPFTLEDLNDFYEYARVDGVGQMAGWISHQNIEKSKQILDNFISEKKTFAITYNNKVIGSLGIEFYDEKKIPEYNFQKGREIGFVLSKDYWGQGFMPEAVKAYINTSNLYNVLEVQKRIIDDYKDDIAKYSTKMMKEKVRECFESIPDQLAKDNKKFQYKVIRQGGTARYYGNSLSWILDSGLGIKVNRLKTFDIPLRAYRDPNAFKFYLNDTGLLLAFYKENLSNEIINGNLGVFKGGVFENIVAQSLIDNELDIYYYQKNDNLEIDFITYLNNKIIPIEVKFGNNKNAVSIKNIVEKEKLDYGIILSMNNLNCSNSQIKFIPLYMIMFIKNV